MPNIVSWQSKPIIIKLRKHNMWPSTSVPSQIKFTLCLLAQITSSMFFCSEGDLQKLLLAVTRAWVRFRSLLEKIHQKNGEIQLSQLKVNMLGSNNKTIERNKIFFLIKRVQNMCKYLFSRFLRFNKTFRENKLNLCA